jgi:hypothetical protein
MDERLEKAIEIANYMTTLSNQKKILQEKYHSDLIYFISGGQFTASNERIAFCNALVQQNQKQTVLVDDNGLPVEIEDITEFTEKLVDTYVQASRQFYDEYAKLKTKRSVEDLVS